jgi:putative transposase
VWPNTRQQRCWVHKTANVLNVLPKSVHGKAKKDLHAIHEAESHDKAEAAFGRFLGKYGAKYGKAAACLAKDRAALLAFYDFPAEHWKHVRTSNPVESTFATVRLRTDETKGCLSRETALAMVFKLANQPNATGAGSMAPSAWARSSTAYGSAMASPPKTPRSKPPPDPVPQI